MTVFFILSRNLHMYFTALLPSPPSHHISWFIIFKPLERVVYPHCVFISSCLIQLATLSNLFSPCSNGKKKKKKNIFSKDFLIANSMRVFFCLYLI